ncbi:hypothetical protein EHS25_007798 [Saitozyma podzolica]|uniref:Uncharacterized protein n=1 Tax=Saitozyma podzolica TaxID=1890683 RepID=A0A427YQT0_9TREE|nr:hypothetical protein EHS25_007798 [Saitozyma podzolica]
MASLGLGDISEALKQVLSASDESSFLQLLEKNLSADSQDVRRATIDTLYDLLTDPTAEDLQSRRTFVLSDTSLTLLPLFLSFFSLAPWSTTSLSLLLAQYAQPKEVVLALDEALRDIEERAVRFDVSDNEDEQGEEPVDDGLNVGELVGQLEVVLKCFVVALPRLPNARSTPTLLNLSDSLLSLLQIIAPECDPAQSRQLLISTSELVSTAWVWSQTTSDKGGEQRHCPRDGSRVADSHLPSQAILTQILFGATYLFGRNVDADLLKSWFFNTFPRLDLHRSNTGADQDRGGIEALEKVLVSRPLGASDPPPNPFPVDSPLPPHPLASSHCLSHSQDTSDTLSIDPSTLLSNLTARSHLSPTSIHTAYASLLLLASSLVLRPESLPAQRPPLDTHMDLLVSALGSGLVDATTTWIWDSVNFADPGDVSLEVGKGLVEVLVPLIAFERDPGTRLALWKLVGALIDKVPRGAAQIDIFQDLLDPSNPFEQIRVETLSLVREQLHKSAQSGSGDESSTPTLFQPSLLTVLPTTAPDLSLSAEQFLSSPEASYLISLLDTLRIFYSLDKAGTSGIRNSEWKDTVLGRLIVPIKERCERWHTELGETSVEQVRPAQGQGQEQEQEQAQGHERHEHEHEHGAMASEEEFLLMRLEDAVGRLQEVLERP